MAWRWRIYQFVRRIIPSTALLTRHPAFFAPIKVVDRAVEWAAPDVAPLPPPI